MRHVIGLAVALVAIAAVPSFAQEVVDTTNAKGYVSGFAGAASAGGNSTGSVLLEGGARVAPHVMVFGNVGRFANLQADLQPTLDSTTNALNTEGVGVTGSGTLPAWYGIVGLRAEAPVSKHALPYVLGGIGTARLNPTPQFMFSSGALPDGTTPDVGTDVTSSLVSAGSITAPAASNAFMFTLGGGVQVPVVSRWAADVGYRYSRIAADTTLSAAALNTNVVTFGIGYRF